MDVRPLVPFGVEVIGIDLRSRDSATARLLPELLAEHHVLVVRAQSLDASEQIDATGLFGPVLDERGSGTRYTFVSNVRPDAVAPDGELAWHQDGAFLDDPFPVIALYAVHVDEAAAPTCFASNALAYDSLPSTTRDRVEGMRAVHTFSRQMRTSYAGVESAVTDEEPTAFHPVVMRHHVSGRAFLYLNGLMTRRILDVAESESEAMLRQLQASIYADPHVLVHRWRTGDLVIWDNLVVQHRRPVGRDGAVRDLRRTIIGDEWTAAQYRAFRTWLGVVAG